VNIDVVMPTIGAGTTQGKILQWRKQPGDAIKVGEILADIETDKAVIELEAVDGGVLDRIHVQAGDAEVPVGSVIATLRADADRVQETTPVPAAAPVAEVAAPRVNTAVARIFASPSARHWARKLGVDLAGLQGSGPRGRIVRVDIEKAAGVPCVAPDPGVTQGVPGAPVVQAVAGSQPAYVVPHTAMRRTIARRLTQSKQEIPHFYLSVDCRADALLGARAQLNAQIVASTPTYSLNDFIVLAVARAVRRVPQINVQWTDAGTLQHPQIDVGVAVALEQGLITPVLRNVDTKGLQQLAKELRELVALARAGRLQPQQYEGGSLCISNLGMYGVHEFSAIINPPQCAILAVGALQRVPVVQGDAVVPGNVVRLTLSADHRIVDGVLGAKFLQQVKTLLENPLELVL